MRHSTPDGQQIQIGVPREKHDEKKCEDEYYFSSLANRLSAPAWEAAGARNALDQAADRVRNILAAPPKVFLSDKQSAMKAVLAKAEASLANLEVPCEGGQADNLP